MSLAAPPPPCRFRPWWRCSAHAALAFALWVPSHAALAQDQTVAASEPAVIDFEATTVSFDNATNIVVAEGAVQLRRDAWALRADRVTWNRTSGEVVAEGNVVLTSPQGDASYADRVVLTDSLRDGIVENLLVVMDNGARLAALRGERLPNGDMRLERAAYTPCAVENPDGCPREPTWQVRANSVYYDRARNRVRYDGARIELFGLPLIPLPFLSHPATSEADSGVLLPELRLDRVNGLEVALPYYLRVNPSIDTTITPHIYTNSAPMLEGEVRGLTGRGAYTARGYATYSRRVDVSGTPGEGNAFRGYLDTTAGFQFSPGWSLSASGRIATDRTFLRRYDISRDDRLRSTFALNRQTPDSLLMIQGWAVQTLRVGDVQNQQPIALPLISWRQHLAGLPGGGSAMLEANTLSLIRVDGQDTQRAFAGATANWRRFTPMGQIIDLSALARADIYHTDNVLATSVPAYRGAEGWQARAFGGAALDVRWPLVGPLWGGTQRLTPRIQLAGTTPVDNVDIPNEDSRAFELEDGNIFALNRFPGHDRFEDGARLTYGLEWAFAAPGLTVDASVAQSYRFGSAPSLFPDGTGLTNNTSDVVGRTTIAFRDVVRLTHRFRLDKDSLAVRRNELDATLGSTRTYALVGYSRLNRDIASLGEDLRDREEIRVGGRVQLARYWSMFGSAIVDLTSANEDPLSTADGFTPVRHRLGIAYDDDCLSIGLTWRRDYQDTGDARRGNSFLLRVALRNLGV